MPLSSDLISQFVKITKDDKKVAKETTVYGTVVYDDKPYVKLDGSDLLTPISTTTNVKDGERVTVMIKDHTAVVTGNLSSPSARTEEVKHVESQLTEFGSVVAHKITANDIQATTAIINKLTAITGKYQELAAVTAEIETLKADLIEGETLKATDIEAITAKIESIEAKFGEFTDIQTEDLEAFDAEITNLKGYTADFTYVSAIEANVKKLNAENVLINALIAKKIDADLLISDEAVIDILKSNNIDVISLITEQADIEKLKAGEITADDLKVTRVDVVELNSEKLGTDEAYVKYADIDFANIGEAAIRKIFADTGLIRDLIVGDQKITGELVGVTIKGDLIEGNTVVADKLVIRDKNGLLYKLNFECGNFIDAEEVPTDGLHGSVIVAKSITAEKVAVDDLVAFGATIGGFHITGADGDNENGAIYSGTKESIDSSIPGVYLGQDGQMSLGDGNNYLRYYRDENGEYKLEISAESILFGSGVKDSLKDIKELTEHVRVGTWVDPETGDVNPSVELSEGDSDFKQVITNRASRILDGENVVTEMNTDGIETENVTVRNEIRQGQWVWTQHGGGNLGLMWKEEFN